MSAEDEWHDLVSNIEGPLYTILTSGSPQQQARVRKFTNTYIDRLQKVLVLTELLTEEQSPGGE